MERSYADFYERSRLSKAKGVFKKFGLWLWGAIGLGGIIAAYLGSVATEILPAPRDLVCLVKEQFHDPAPGTHFTILISNLAGDSDGRQTNHVRDAFLNERGLDVRRTCRVVALDAVGGSVADAAAEAMEEGRALLADWNADLLIWGEVKKADQELNLWFLGGRESTLGAPSYSLTEKLTLPEDFETDFGAQLVAVAAAQVAPATEQAGTYLVDLLQPVAARLERLVDNPPAGLGAERIADLHFSLALASATLGEQSGQREPLERAVAAYREALKEMDPRARPAPVGDDPEQPGHRAPDAGRAGERHGAPGRGGRGLPRGPQGEDPRARPARVGHDPEQPGQRASDAWASGRAARRAWTRRSRPTARPSRRGPASASRSTGR